MSFTMLNRSDERGCLFLTPDLCCLVTESCLTLLQPHGVGCHSFFQGVNPGSEPMSPAWREDSLPLGHQENPLLILWDNYSVFSH